LTFTSAASALVSLRLPATTLGGSFAFDHVGPDGQQWRFDALDVSVRLWPGGSSGSVVPALVRVDAVVPPAGAAAPTATTPGALAAPTLPSHWRTLAVWPRREVCNDGAGGEPFDANDALIGLSPTALVDELVAASPWTIAGDDGIRIDVDVEAPRGLVCVSSVGARQELDVRATLSAANAPSGSPLEHLEATTVLRIGGRISLDGSRFEELSWQRRDVVYEIPRADFQRQTGLALAAPDEYQAFWWSWHGRNVRDSAGAWSSQGALLVSSLDAQQTTQIAAQVAAGGPGAGVGVDNDGFPLLPGDTLVDEPLAP